MSSEVKEENLAAELLKNAHPFELEAPLVQRLSLLLTVQHFKANEFLFREGEPSDAVFIVGSGAVQLVMHAQHLVEFQPGQTVGEVGLIENRERRCDCVAVFDSILLVLRRDMLFGDKMPPEISSKIFLYMAKRMTSLLGGVDAYREMDVLLVQDGGCSPGYNAVTSYLAEYFSDVKRKVYIANTGFKSLVSGQSSDFSMLAHDYEIYRSLSLVPGVGFSQPLREQRGASFRTERFPQFKEPANQQRAAETILRFGVKTVVFVGGNGTLGGTLALAKLLPDSVQMFYIPATIDSDVGGTECIGQHTAVEMGAEKLRCYLADARTHHRCYLIEMMGRDGGFHCLYSALGAGVHLAVMPHSVLNLPFLAAQITKRTHTVIAIAEGYCRGERTQANFNGSASDYLLYQLNQTGQLDTSKRHCVAEPFSRDIRGAPTNNLDMVLSQQFAKAVVSFSLSKKSRLMPCINANAVGFLPFDQIITDNSVSQRECALANHLDPEVERSSTANFVDSAPLPTHDIKHSSERGLGHFIY